MSNKLPLCGSRDALETGVMGLAMECPYVGGNPAGCPLHEVRNLGLWERVKLIYCLSDEDLDILWAEHQNCLRKHMREEALKNGS